MKKRVYTIAENETNALILAGAIRTFAANPDALNNFISYLTYHFPDWLNKYANTPEDLAVEMKSFAEMKF